jgi:hypothetical protein
MRGMLVGDPLEAAGRSTLARMPPTPQQRVRQERAERLIGLFAPALDLVLSVGDRFSRIVGRGEEYYPIRSGAEAFELSAAAEREEAERERAGVRPDA